MTDRNSEHGYNLQRQQICLTNYFKIYQFSKHCLSSLSVKLKQPLRIISNLIDASKISTRLQIQPIEIRHQFNSAEILNFK